MTITSVEAALRVAIEKEEQSRAFYAQWAERARDPGAAALLGSLAADEVAHKERLEQGLVLQAGGVPMPPPADLHLADVLVEKELTEDATIQDVLISAMHREQRARQMYVDLAKWVAGDELRDLLRALADDEAHHKARIEAIYDDLVLTDD